MKKWLAIPVSLIVIASGLLAYDLYLRQYFETPKKTWDMEYETTMKNGMKVKGDTVVIEEEFQQVQKQNGEGIVIVKKLKRQPKRHYSNNNSKTVPMLHTM